MQVYSFIAVMLTDWECLRTQSEYDSSLTFKLYVHRCDVTCLCAGVLVHRGDAD